MTYEKKLQQTLRNNFSKHTLYLNAISLKLNVKRGGKKVNMSNVLGKLYLKVQMVSEKSEAKNIIFSFEFCDRHTSNAGISHILKFHLLTRHLNHTF
ncbi:CLUMA_CG005473, isoform A [Clunio marinus]|uniref:CLUMA_CG005473, isoform A n=1 Tax=Clunio marinus TaxID=568069 RepID=A0A1J1HWX2_9DIPT|nr:CLUMA_CG005473, isoform A [Clunio marinus]